MTTVDRHKKSDGHGFIAFYDANKHPNL